MMLFCSISWLVYVSVQNNKFQRCSYFYATRCYSLDHSLYAKNFLNNGCAKIVLYIFNFDFDELNLKIVWNIIVILQHIF